MEQELIKTILGEFGGYGAVLLLLWRVLIPMIADYLNTQKVAIQHIAEVIDLMDKRLAVVEIRIDRLERCQEGVHESSS